MATAVLQGHSAQTAVEPARHHPLPELCRLREFIERARSRDSPTTVVTLSVSTVSPADALEAVRQKQISPALAAPQVKIRAAAHHGCGNKCLVYTRSYV